MLLFPRRSKQLCYVMSNGVSCMDSSEGKDEVIMTGRCMYYPSMTLSQLVRRTPERVCSSNER